jgi:hypothetical protein
MREPAVQVASLPAGIQRVLATALDPERRVLAVHAEPSPLAGAWPADTLTVELDGGVAVALWVKRLSADRHPHPDKAVRDREPRTYAELLGEPGLPVPRSYGCARNPDTGEQLLILERIGD